MKLKSITSFTLALLFTTTTQAGLTNDILANGFSVESLVSEHLSLDMLTEQAKNSIIQVTSTGLAGTQNEKDPAKDDVVTGNDSRPFTLNQDIKKTLDVKEEDGKEIDLTTLQGQVQQAYLNKPETLYQESELDATSRDVAMGANAKIEIDPKKDASVAGSKEAIQAARHAGLENARAIAMATLAKYENTPNVDKKNDANINARKTEIAQASGHSVQNQATGITIDHMIAISASQAEIDNFKLMQDKYLNNIQK